MNFEFYRYVFLTLVFLYGWSAIVKMLHYSTQEGQWLGKWQDQLLKWDEQGKHYLAKWGGACTVCYCMFMSSVGLPIYIALTQPWAIFGWWSFLVVWLFWGVQFYWNLRFVNKK